MADRDDRDAIELSIDDVDVDIGKAVRRGVLRTAVDVFALIILAGLVINLVGGAFWAIGGRREHLSSVITTGVTVAHPEFALSGSGCCSTTTSGLQVGPVELTLLSPNPVPPAVELTPHINWAGHLDAESVRVPDTALGEAIQHLPAPSKAEADRRLSGLPVGLDVSAIVFFREPVSIGDLDRIIGAGDAFGATVLYDVPDSGRNQGAMRIGWATLSGQGFQGWAASLNSGDDDVLQGIGLPTYDTIQQVANDGQVTGVVLGSVSVSALQHVLQDPRVSSVQAAEASFDLGIPHSDN